MARPQMLALLVVPVSRTKDSPSAVSNFNSFLLINLEESTYLVQLVSKKKITLIE
jgi:hypothetical protein